MVCDVQSMKRIGDIQGMLIYVRAGAGTYGKGNFIHFDG
jgi:hypothetical protein